jgi:hypothetical protein
MRIFNRLLALLVALAVAGTSLIVIVEVIAARSHSAPLLINWHAILRWGQRNTWRATSVELACGISTGVGLLLLVPQLLRRRPTRLSVEAGDDTDAALTRKGVAVTMRGAVAEVDGVIRARVKVGRHRIRVNAIAAGTESASASALEPNVEEAARKQLAALRLRPSPRLHVAISRRTGLQ